MDDDILTSSIIQISSWPARRINRKERREEEEEGKIAELHLFEIANIEFSLSKQSSVQSSSETKYLQSDQIIDLIDFV